MGGQLPEVQAGLSRDARRKAHNGTTWQWGPGLGQFLRPARWPPARRFPICPRPRDEVRQGWGRFWGGCPPGPCGSRWCPWPRLAWLCSREHLETGCLETRALPCAAFPRGGRGGPVPPAAECGPSQAPGPAPKPQFSEGADSRPSGLLPAGRPAGPLWSCPGNARCRTPGPERRVTERPVFQVGLWNVPGAADSGRSAAAAFLVRAGPAPSFFHAPVPAPAARGRERRFPWQPHSLLLLTFLPQL